MQYSPKTNKNYGHSKPQTPSEAFAQRVVSDLFKNHLQEQSSQKSKKNIGKMNHQNHQDRQNGQKEPTNQFVPLTFQQLFQIQPFQKDKKTIRDTPNHQNHQEEFINQIPSGQMSFAPFVSTTLQVQNRPHFYPGSAFYNQKHNLIIVGPQDGGLEFYDATTFTLLPFEGITRKELDNSVMEMSFWPETETYLLVGSSGKIYYYHLSGQFFREIQKDIWTNARMITFLNSRYYAFSTPGSSDLFVGGIESGKLYYFNLRKSQLIHVEGFPKRKLLFSTLENGSVIIHGTDRLPKLTLLYSRRHQQGECEIQTQNITMNKKELVITAGTDCKIRIWNLLKGKMKLLRVIFTKEKVFRSVYLSRYKMLATTHNKDYISFYSLTSGKLECTLSVNMLNCQGIFLMEDENSLGVTEVSPVMDGKKSFKPRIKIVQLQSLKVKVNQGEK